MTSAYWAQESRAEILSMHGVEIDEDDDQDPGLTTVQDEDQNTDYFDRYSISWRDFL